MTVEVRIEVKCSRRGRFSVGARDLKGIYTEGDAAVGFLAVLVTSDLHAGPYWMLVPGHQLQKRSYNDRALTTLKADPDFWRQINQTWGDVLLHEEMTDKLLTMPKINFKTMEWWQKLSFTPHDIPSDAIRKVKVAEALQHLRTRLDKEHGRAGARREGFLHQCILCYALLRAGYETVSNISGVPDLRAKVPQRATSATA